MKVNISPKYVGIALIVISIALFFVILSFTQSIQKLNQFLHQDCTLPDEICPFKKDVPWESSVGFSMDVVIFILGLLLIMTGKPIEIQPKTKRYSKLTVKTISLDDPTERKIYNMIKESDAIFQSELVEKAGMSKVRITRILDKLEAKGLVERKRRGMTNVVIAKR